MGMEGPQGQEEEKTALSTSRVVALTLFSTQEMYQGASMRSRMI